MWKPKKTVQAQCPTCKEQKPHETLGIRRGDDGVRFEAMTCNACGTTTTIYEDPEGFRVVYDWPDDDEG